MFKDGEFSTRIILSFQQFIIVKSQSTAFNIIINRRQKHAYVFWFRQDKISENNRFMYAYRSQINNFKINKHSERSPTGPNKFSRGITPTKADQRGPNDN